MTLKIWIGASCLLLMAVGCSDDESSGGGKAFAELPSDRPLIEFNDAEQQRFCDGVAAWMESVQADPKAKRGMCLAAGALQAALSDLFSDEKSTVEEQISTCKAAQQKCLESPNQTRACQRPLDDCDATVGEIERCLQLETEALQWYSGYTCKDAVGDALPDSAPNAAELKKCRSVVAVCVPDDDVDGGT